MDSAAQCRSHEDGVDEEDDAAHVMADLHLLAEAERAFRDSGRDPADVCAFSVIVAESSAAAAGRGVHLFGSAVKGAVVGVYRGTVFEMEDLAAMHALICHGNDYLMFRRDGVLIDGREEGSSRAVFESALLREAAAAHVAPAEARQRAWDHPFAVGQLVNHPPPGCQPNVCAFPVDLYAEAAQELVSLLRWISVPFRSLAPSRSHSPPAPPPAPASQDPPGPSSSNRALQEARGAGSSEASSSSSAPRGRPPQLKAVVLRALREISNEELFLDYKLQTDAPPEWYFPPDT